jgi:AraC-like DNA-binding protein
MQPSLGIESGIYLIGIANAFFWSVILWTAAKGSPANRILAVCLALLALVMGDNLMVTTQLILRFPVLFEVGFVFAFILGPLVLLYVQALTRPSFSLAGLKLLHFVPFLLCVGYYLPLFAASNGQKMRFFNGTEGVLQTNYYPVDVMLISTLAPIHIAIYLIWTAILLFKHAQRVKDYYSSLEKVRLTWLRNLLLASVILWLPDADTWLGINFVSHHFHLVSSFLFTGFVFMMGYQGVRQPQLFIPSEAPTPNSAEELPPPATEEPGKKYEKSGLSTEKTETYLQQLRQAIEKDKLYTNPELTLQELADTLAISTNHLSQLLNERLGVNFFDFVNGYRVAEIKQELLNPRKRHLTILAIAFESGFNSKTAFNVAFKKHTGLSPSQFKRQATSTTNSSSAAVTGL